MKKIQQQFIVVMENLKCLHSNHILGKHTNSTLQRCHKELVAFFTHGRGIMELAKIIYLLYVNTYTDRFMH